MSIKARVVLFISAISSYGAMTSIMPFNAAMALTYSYKGFTKWFLMYDYELLTASRKRFPDDEVTYQNNCKHMKKVLCTV